MDSGFGSSGRASGFGSEGHEFDTRRDPTAISYFFAIIKNSTKMLAWAMVVAQAVEQWHSVRAGWVRIPGRPRLFRFTITANPFSLGAGIFSKE